MEGRYKTSLSLEGQVSVGYRHRGQVNLTIPTRSPVQIPVQRRSFHVSLASSAEIAAFKSDAVARYPVRSSSLAMRSLSVMAAMSPPLGLSIGEACCLVNRILTGPQKNKRLAPPSGAETVDDLLKAAVKTQPKPREVSPLQRFKQLKW